MTDEVKTREQLLADLKKAYESGDMKALRTVSKQIDEFDTAAEKAGEVAKQEALKERWEAVYGELIGTGEEPGVIRDMVEKGELDTAEGIWIRWDFGETDEKGINPSLKFFKAQKLAGTGGTKAGKGRKFPSTLELLKDHGDKVEEKSGKTWRELYDEAKGDGNKVYQVRMKLGKALGVA